MSNSIPSYFTLPTNALTDSVPYESNRLAPVVDVCHYFRIEVIEKLYTEITDPTIIAALTSATYCKHFYDGLIKAADVVALMDKLLADEISLNSFYSTLHGDWKCPYTYLYSDEIKQYFVTEIIPPKSES